MYSATYDEVVGESPMKRKQKNPGKKAGILNNWLRE